MFFGNSCQTKHERALSWFHHFRGPLFSPSAAELFVLFENEQLKSVLFVPFLLLAVQDYSYCSLQWEQLFHYFLVKVVRKAIDDVVHNTCDNFYYFYTP